MVPISSPITFMWLQWLESLDELWHDLSHLSLAYRPSLPHASFRTDSINLDSLMLVSRSVYIAAGIMHCEVQTTMHPWHSVYVSRIKAVGRLLCTASLTWDVLQTAADSTDAEICAIMRSNRKVLGAWTNLTNQTMNWDPKSMTRAPTIGWGKGKCNAMLNTALSQVPSS